MIRIALILAFIAALAWLGPALDDHSLDAAQADDIEAAYRTADARKRFERAAQALCGPQAAWAELADGAVQCMTKRGRPTVTARVAP